jgi:hypothetical protein
MHTVEAEIFAPGTWNKTWKFAAKDLHDIVANFKALGDNHHVPLKFGHNDKQPMTDGYPALGWVSDVWVKDDKLIAKFESVPSIVKKAFDAKLYRHVSVELDVDVEHRGKKYKYVLSAVALLGADIPAVNTLNDLKHYLDGGERLAASRRESFSAVQGNLTTEPEEGKDMDKKEIQEAIAAAIAPLEANVAKFSTENATLKAENATLKAAQEKQTETEAASKIKLHRESLTAKLETAVKGGILTPAQREGALRFMRIADDKAVLETTDAQVDEYIKINGNAKKVNMSENGRGNGTQGNEEGGKEYESPGAEIVARAQKLQGEDGKLSFAAARDRVMKAAPELAKAWLGTDENAA